MQNKSRFDAITSLVGGELSGSSDGKNIYFHSGQTPPTEAEIDAEVIRLQAEYDAQEYARKRQEEYPSIAELTVALYDTSDKAALVAKRAAVKAKYPKPE
jgi:hypothetical protein